MDEIKKIKYVTDVYHSKHDWQQDGNDIDKFAYGSLIDNYGDHGAKCWKCKMQVSAYNKDFDKIISTECIRTKIYGICPHCHATYYTWSNYHIGIMHCSFCGQKIDFDNPEYEIRHLHRNNGKWEIDHK